MSHQPRRPKVLWHLVEDSLSEAEFLWTRLDAKLDAHDHALAHVEIWVEERLHGALDGVRVAGAAAIDPLLMDALRDTTPGLVAVAAYVLSGLSDRAADRVLQDALRDVQPSQVQPFARGLGRAAQTKALASLWESTSDAPALARAVVLEALAFCGHAPDVDFGPLLESEAPSLRAAAAGALCYAPAARMRAQLQRAIHSQDPEVRNRALRAGVAAGDRDCWLRCLQLVKQPDVHCGPLLLMAAALGGSHEVARVVEALAVPELRRDALWALGFAGTSVAVEACLAQLRAGQHVQVAAEAVCAITGLPLPVQPSPPDAVAQDEELAWYVAPTPDDSLPMPDLAALSQAWASESSRFAADTRYTAGHPTTLLTLLHGLEHGPTRRRHAIAFQLSARTGGACALQPLAFCSQQRQQLSRFPALAATTLREASRALGAQPLAEA